MMVTRVGRETLHSLSVGPQVCHDVHRLKRGINDVVVPNKVLGGFPGDNAGLENAALSGRHHWERSPPWYPMESPMGPHRVEVHCGLGSQGQWTHIAQ